MLSVMEKENIKSGVEKYKLIMKKYCEVNVSKDKDFQRLYNGFYRVAHRSKEWYLRYYQILEGLKIKNRSFEDILRALDIQGTGRIEASFSSKMCATRNPDYPIIDKWVLKRMGWSLPHTKASNRIEKTARLYDSLIRRYEDLLSNREGRRYIKWFDEICPKTKITKVKKIDFILWQLGRGASGDEKIEDGQESARA